MVQKSVWVKEVSPNLHTSSCSFGRLPRAWTENRMFSGEKGNVQSRLLLHDVTVFGKTSPNSAVQVKWQYKPDIFLVV